jgi:HEAT repeat protein
MTVTAGNYATRLRARQTTARLQAVEELGRMGTTAVPWLLTALDDKSNLVVAAAARALTAVGEEKCVPQLIACYHRLAAAGPQADSGCQARLELVKALTAYRAAEAVDVFLSAVRTYQPERTGNGMDDTAIPLRVQAARALAELHIPGALLRLALLLFDTEPRVPTSDAEKPYATMTTRVAAARALGSLGEPGAAAILGLRLAYGHDEVAEVLVECMDALAELDEAAMIELATPYLKHRDAYLVAGAATALARMPAPYHEQVLPLLQTACESASGEACISVALAIAAVRSAAAVDCLAELADYHQLEVRLAAVTALRERGDEDGVRVLHDLAQRTGDRQVAAAARAALRESR